MACRYRICEYQLKWESCTTPLTQQSMGLSMRVSRSDPEGLAEPQREQCSKTRVDLRKQLSQRGSTVIE